MKKLKNFLISKGFLMSLGIAMGIYIVAVVGFRSYLTNYTNHGLKVSVPNLLEKNELQVEALVNHLGLKYEISEVVYDPQKPEGTVVGQDPLPSRQTNVFVKEGRLIRIKVSKKTQLVEMPQCVNKSQRFAERILTNRGLRYKIEYQPSIESAGAVIQQQYLGREVKEKEQLKIGSTITLVVGRNSEGETFLLPDFNNLTICEAKDRLFGMEHVQLIVVCDNCLSSEDSCQAIVFSQSPEYIEGLSISTGATITLHASR